MSVRNTVKSIQDITLKGVGVDGDAHIMWIAEYDGRAH